jgi:hypothetical protein
MSGSGLKARHVLLAPVVAVAVVLGVASIVSPQGGPGTDTPRSIVLSVPTGATEEARRSLRGPVSRAVISWRVGEKSGTSQGMPWSQSFHDLAPGTEVRLQATQLPTEKELTAEQLLNNEPGEMQPAVYFECEIGGAVQFKPIAGYDESTRAGYETCQKEAVVV